MAPKGQPMPRRAARGKAGTFIGKPHRTSAPAKIDPRDEPDVIPVDPTRVTTPIPGLAAGKRKT